MSKKIVVIFAVLFCMTALGVGAQEGAQPIVELGFPVLLGYEFPLSAIEDEELTSEVLNRLRVGINVHLVFNLAPVIALGVESGVSVGFTEPNYQQLIVDSIDLPNQSFDLDTQSLLSEIITLDVPLHLIVGFNLALLTLDVYGGVVFRDVDSLDLEYSVGEIGTRLNFLGLLVDLGYIFPASLDGADKTFLDYTSNVFRIGIGVQAGR